MLLSLPLSCISLHKTIPHSPRPSPTHPPPLSSLDSIKKSPLSDSTDTLSAHQDTASISSANELTHPIKDNFTDNNIAKKKEKAFYTNSSEGLDGPVKFKAKDSSVIRIQSKKVYLFKDANVQYKDMDIKGNHMEMDQIKKQVTLFPSTDTMGNVHFKDKTIFKQDKSTYLSDTVHYNYQTQKSITQNTFTTQGELVVFGEKIKKINENEAFVKKARFSTCNLNHPHFSFVSPKAKFKREKYGATTYTFLQIEDVKIPIPAPFAMFPLSKGVKNGILPPSFDQNSSWGYGLREGGYYLKISDFFDAAIRGSIYSFGTWTINTRTRYKLRYRFSGSLNVDFQSVNTTLFGDLRPNKSRTFNIQYNHQVDHKASPNASFNINLNFGSSQYNRQQIYDPEQNFNNSINSSINYARQFNAFPSNLSISANHAQNSNTRAYNITLPSISYSISNFQPLQFFNKSGINHWYDKLTFQYIVNYTSNVNFVDTSINFKQLVDTFRWGVQHIPSISLPLPPLGPLILTPSITYRENWTDQRITFSENPHTGNLDRKVERGLFRMYDLAMGAGLSTNIFGTFLFNTSTIKGIRHVIHPQVSVSYHPNVNRASYYSIVQNESRFVRRMNYFQNALFGTFGEGKSANLNFGISSSIEMKIRDRNDTTEKASFRKIPIIDNFSVGGTYNLLKDTLNPRQLSNINFSIATNILQKVRMNASASLDPYAYDNTTGAVKRMLSWQDKSRTFSLGRFTNFSFTLSSTIKYGVTKKRNDQHDEKTRKLSLSAGHFQDSLSKLYGYYVYVDSTIANQIKHPNFSFSLNIGYNISYNERFMNQKGIYQLNLSNQNLSLSGNIQLTDNWILNFNTNLNIADNFIFLALNKINIPYLTLGVQRRLHCWLINMNITPLGLTKSFSIVLRPVASILQDLKIERNRSFFEQ